MANSNATMAPHRAAAGIPGSGWQVVWGILLIVAGVLAVMMPVVAAFATALVFAWVLIVAGGCEIVYAIQARQADGFGWKLASGILTFVLGVVILFVPVAGIASLALLVGAFLLVGGVARSMLALRLRPRSGWGWILFDGLLSVILAVLIAVGWPATSLALIGLLTGFALISTGIWRIALRHALAA